MIDLEEYNNFTRQLCGFNMQEMVALARWARSYNLEGPIKENARLVEEVARSENVFFALQAFINHPSPPGKRCLYPEWRKLKKAFKEYEETALQPNKPI